MGRRPSLTGEQQAEVRRLADDGWSLRWIAERYGVGKDAVRRAVAAARQDATAVPASSSPSPMLATSRSSPRVPSPRPAATLAGFPNQTVTQVWTDSPGGGGARRDVRRTRTVRVAGVPVQVDEQGRVHCEGCLDWIDLGTAIARGSPHRAIPGRSFVAPGLLRPLDGAR